MGLYQVRVQYGGFPGSPGFSTFHFGGSNETVTQSSSVKAAAAHDLVADFMTALFGTAPTVGDGTTFSVLSDVVVRNETNGQGLTQFTVTPVGGTAPGTAETLPSANCLVYTWRTATFGPRGRGRTFLAPGDELQNIGGTPDSTTLSDAITRANAFIAAAAANIEVEFVVWHRPTAPLPTSGFATSVDSVSITDQWAILKSRRD